MSVNMATKEVFEKEVTQESLPVLVVFSAPWCGYCRRIEPALEQLSQKHAGKIKVLKVDVDSEPELAERFQVETIPNLLLFQNGENGESLIAPGSLLQIEDWLKENKAL